MADEINAPRSGRCLECGKRGEISVKAAELLEKIAADGADPGEDPEDDAMFRMVMAIS